MKKVALGNRCCVLVAFLCAVIAGGVLGSHQGLAFQPSGHCYHTNVGACKPNGVGRVFDDYWTYWTRERHFGLWGCKVSNGSATFPPNEQCYGAITVIFKWRVVTYTFGAFLSCPQGSAFVDGECIEPDNIPQDMTCPMSVGNPIDVLSGRKHERIEDWTSGGEHPLKLERFYSSFHTVLSAPSYSSLGKGWRTNFDAAASWNGADPASSTLVHIVLPNAFEYSFVKQSGLWKPVLPRWRRSGFVWDRIRTDIDIGLTADQSGIILRMQDGKRFSFDGSGKLTRALFRDGYAQSVTYSSGRIARVSDNLGRWLEFTYGGANTPLLLGAVRTSDGRKVSYSYENRYITRNPEHASRSFNDNYWVLKAATQSDSTPANSDDNPKQIYTYLDDSANPLHLAAITDERGIRFAEWTYDEKGRATSSQHAGGVDRWQLVHDDAGRKVTVTNPLGRQTVYTYRRIQGVIKQLVAVDGIATTNCAQSNTQYVYDANGFRSQATDADGRITTWTRNSRGLPLNRNGRPWFCLDANPQHGLG
jgi:YD repeat-containing protein